MSRSENQNNNGSPKVRRVRRRCETEKKHGQRAAEQARNKKENLAAEYEQDHLNLRAECNQSYHVSDLY